MGTLTTRDCSWPIRRLKFERSIIQADFLDRIWSKNVFFSTGPTPRVGWWSWNVSYRLNILMGVGLSTVGIVVDFHRFRILRGFPGLESFLAPKKSNDWRIELFHQIFLQKKMSARCSFKFIKNSSTTGCARESETQSSNFFIRF